MNKDEKLIEEIRTLKNKMWVTSRIRMRSAERLLANANFLDHMSAYYSIMLATFSIIGLLYKDNLYELINVLISVALLGIIYYGNSMNFRDRYSNMKDNYLSIEKIWYDLISNEDSIDSKKLNNYYDRYNEILSKVENHNVYDYIVYLKEEYNKNIDLNDEKQKNHNILLKNKFKNFCHINTLRIFKGLVIAIPVAVSVYSIFVIFK